jgi:dihydrodipicolinate synthase/N-acetylneuraminate lyase
MTDFKHLKSELEGVHSYLPTPFLSDFRLDPDGMKQNVAFHAETPNENLIVTVCGAYGEGFTLNLDEHKDAVAAAVEGADGKVHVMAGVVGGYGNQHLMARNAEEAGAGSIIIFFPTRARVSEETAYSYFRDLAESVNIGVIAFPCAGNEENAQFWDQDGPRVLERLAEIPNIVGFLSPATTALYDDSVKFGKAVNSLVPERYLWVAENEGNAMKTFPFGCRAYTTAAPAITPLASLKFWEHGVNGEEDQMIEVFENHLEPILQIRRFGIDSIKVALELLGRAGGPPRPPNPRIRKEDRPLIADILRKFPELGDIISS